MDEELHEQIRDAMRGRIAGAPVRKHRPVWARMKRLAVALCALLGLVKKEKAR